MSKVNKSETIIGPLPIEKDKRESKDLSDLAESEMRSVPIENLHLDPSNPRLPDVLKERDEKSIVNFLLKTANVLELMTSIAEKGYFTGEPLLAVLNVEKTTSESEWYDVVEGNRRLTAVKLLNDPGLAEIRQISIKEIIDIARHIPTSIPVVVFKKRDAIVEYLGYRHITGVKAWDSLSKARYMKSLLEYTSSKDLRGKYREIARIIGSKPNYVSRILNGLKLFEIAEKKDFFDLKIDRREVKFSLFTTALSYIEIARYVGIDSVNDGFKESDISLPNLKQLVSWVYEERDGSTRIGESRNLAKLAKVVAEEKALAAFVSQQKTLDEALLFTDEPRELLDTSLNDAVAALNLANSTWVSVEDLRSSDVKILDDIRQISIRIRNSIQTELDGRDVE